MTTQEDFEKWFADSHPLYKENAFTGSVKSGLHAAWQACAVHYEAKIALYEAAKLYDEAPDDAEFEPPHPVFQLAQERDNYADQIRNLLALIAEKDKALKALDDEARNRLETAMNAHQWLRNLKMFPEWLDKAIANMDECMETLKHNDPVFYEQIQKALSLTHDSVRLVEAARVGKLVNSVCLDSTNAEKRWDYLPIGTKLYTLVKGEAG